tara:strand:+ start:1094 stop:2335 length:1242 start_codon:yes stop_codon:yes gene_type:complete
MHQTTSGETHKTIVLERKNIVEFLENNQNIFNDFFQIKNNVLYENKKLINDHVLNYLNVTDDIDFLKDMIRKEFDECEKIYPYLGDVFINYFFEKIKIKNSNLFKFNKHIENKFIKSLKSQYVKNIAQILFENVSLEYTISFDAYNGNDIILEKNNNINFDFDFDFSYYQNNFGKKIKNYNVLVIDGIIDTVGELHHLLYQASTNKENYVIFCLGINEEVKQTILTNNKKRITKVWPIDIKFSEKTLNILNDIAIVHDVDVITALKGQTISQEIKKTLSKGIEITINKNNISIEKVCSDHFLAQHKKFISKRIDESTNEENSKLLKNRYKSLSSKSVNIYLPFAVNHFKFVRELDYLMRFMSNLNKVFTIVKIKNKEYYIPKQYLKIVKEKTQKTKDIINKIDKIIAHNRRNK